MQGQTYSTTEARCRFPDICQDVYGTKNVVGVHRYGRTLCGLLPPEGVMMLAGQGDRLDAHTKRKIVVAAQRLLEMLASAPGR